MNANDGFARKTQTALRGRRELKMATSITAHVDYENNAEEFWDEFRTRVDGLDSNRELGSNCREILRHGEVELIDANAITEFDEFVHSIPGFSGGPSHAPEAIIFQAN